MKIFSSPSITRLPKTKSIWRFKKQICLLLVLVMIASQVLACTTPPIVSTTIAKPALTTAALNTQKAQLNNDEGKTQAPGDVQLGAPPSSLVNNSGPNSPKPVQVVTPPSSLVNNSGPNSPKSLKTGTKVGLVNSMELTLSAANSTVEPINADTGYPVTERLFVDWNMSNLTRWFQWSYPASNFSKAVWQVSMMPFDNSPNTFLNPPGLTASGVLGADSTEFSIDFDKIIPDPDTIKANAGGSDFLTMAQANLSQYAKSTDNTLVQGRVANVNAALNAAKAKEALNTTARKAVINDYAKSLNTFKGLQNSQASKPVIISDTNMQISKSILEAMSKRTHYSFFVRVILLDANDHLVGSPSNSVEALCGEPVFEERVSLLNTMVEAQVETTGDFQYRTAIFLDWNSSPANLTKKYAAPLIDLNNYAYSYFQVTLFQEDPDKDDALNPDGLVFSQLSNQIGGDATGNQCAIAKIDFSKFAPPVDPGKPTQYRYYMRAVHVYSDFTHPGFAKLAFSPPMAVNYGAPGAGSLGSQYTVNIDIGTPSMRFTKYTPPYFGENPQDHAIVAKTPGYPFLYLKIGQPVNIKDLQAIMEDLERAKGNDVFTTLINGFVLMFNGIGNLITSVSDKWNEIQAGVVGAMAGIGIPPVIGGMLLNAALMAAGIPPTLPNFNDLSDMASGKAADFLVEQSGGWVSKEVADAAVQEMVSQAKQAAKKAVTGLPDDLSCLEGCLRPDPSFVWKPATITIELYNPLDTPIYSGSFLLRFVESNSYNINPDTKDFFYPQTVNYPTIQPGKTLTLTIPLDEACSKVVGGGVKDFPEDYKAGVDDTTWNKLILGHQQLAAVITDIQPIIPTPAELGLVFVHYNIIDSHLNIKQNLNNIKTEWNFVDDRFPGAIYVSTGGNDSANGSLYHPVKTLAHAVSLAQQGDAVLLAPGTYYANNLSISKPDITLAGTAAGAIIRITDNNPIPNQPLKPLPPIRGGASQSSLISPPGDWDYIAGKNGDYQTISYKTESSNSGSQVDSTGFISLANSSVVLNVNNADGFALKNLEVDGEIFINSSDGIKLEGVKVLNPGAIGIELDGCQAPSITGCELGQTGSSPSQVWHGTVPDNGIIVSDCYAFMINNCNIHHIAGNGISVSGSSSNLGNIKNCNINNCLMGVILSGAGHKITNCFIHDTRWAGIDFTHSSNCSVVNCTISNTASDASYDGAPLIFDISPDGSNAVLMENTQNGQYPQTDYAENCIIVDSNINLIKVKTNADHSQIGIYTGQNAYLNKNAYYSPSGSVKLVDRRISKTYQFTITGNPPSGISAGWQDYADDRNSIELNPQIDTLGRSIVPDCLGKGVQ